MDFFLKKIKDYTTALKEIASLGGYFLLVIVLAYIAYLLWNSNTNHLTHIQDNTEKQLEISEQQIEILKQIKEKL